jgi:hypothetical protein
MIVNPRQRWIYLDVPRTGSTSLCEFLSRPEQGGVPGKFRHIYEMPPGCEDYFTFATVRHPYPRAVSLWLHFVNDRRARVEPTADATTWPFSRFVDDVLIERRTGPDFYQKACHEWLDPVGRVDAILKAEELAAAVARLGIVRGPFTLPRLNGIARDPWESYYTPERRALVRLWAAEDFERYGYP